MSQKTNQTKTAKKYVRYEDLSKDDLIKMLMRLNKRLTRIQGELRDVINILYYGDLPSGSYQPGGGASTGGGYKGRGGYTRGKGYSGYKYGRYKRAPQPEEGGETGEVEEEPVEEEEPKPSEEKPAEKPAKKEGGGS